ncbi:MAG: hypothetical protein IPG45_21255 [Deltaproteobacteria bacterium]|nr:hypothetical protein [Deltaproteobacteria bacterium]
MIRARFRLFLGVWAGIAACTIEPKVYNFPPIDAGPRPDATVDSGVPTCLDGAVACAATDYCTPTGTCVQKPTACEASDDCRGGEACAIPAIPTSSKTPGRCTAPSWRCSDDQGCGAGQRCTDLGFCARTATHFRVEGGLPTPIATCSTPSDCGAGGLCVDGQCARCQTNADCGGLRCQEGRCVEAETCTGEASCFGPNQCAGGRCARTTDTCTPNPEDDTKDRAEELQAGLHYLDRSICGEEVDWLRVRQEANAGVTVVFDGVTADLEVQIEDVLGDEVEATHLSLPGLYALRAPVSQEVGRDLYLRVRSRDVSGSYGITVESTFGLCAGDALDLYGDGEPSRALIGPNNQAMVRRHCAMGTDLVAVEVEAGDQLRPEALTTTFSDLSLAIIGLNGVDQTTSSTRTPSGAGHRIRAFGPRATMAGLSYVQLRSTRAPSAGLVHQLTIGRALGARQAACNTPVELNLSPTPTTVTGQLTNAVDLGAPACTADPLCSGDNCARYANAAAPEVLYRVTPSAGRSVLRAAVTPGTTGAQLALALLSSCDDDASATTCDRAPLPGRDVALEAELNGTAPVFLVVSGDNAGAFELSASLEVIESPNNDQCAAATALPASNVSAVSTFGAADDLQLGTNSAVCSASQTTGLGPDRFYLLELDAGERAAVELTGPRGGLLWAGRSCLNLTVTCTAAVAIDFSNPVARATFEPAEPTAYFVAVDGLETTDRGTYQLRSVREPELECLDDADCVRPSRCDDYRCVAVPNNDLCPGTRIDLTSNLVRITGSTGAANDDLVPSCTGGSSPDVVYRIPVPSGLSELVVRISDARFDPALAVRFEQCTSSIEELCNDDVRFPDVLLPEVRIAQPEGGTYYVVVDAFAGEGTFTLEVEAIP